MPGISMFYGIIISMYYVDSKRHKNLITTLDIRAKKLWLLSPMAKY
jgi:hypothetical protein